MNEVKPTMNAWPVTHIERLKRDQRKFKDPKEKQRKESEKRQESEDENKIDEYA